VTFVQESPPTASVVARGHARAAIVEATRTLIAERGLHAVRLREVADRAQVSLGSTTYHFPDRDALLVAAQEAHTRKIESISVANTGPDYAADGSQTGSIDLTLRLFVTLTTAPEFAAVFVEICANAHRDTISMTLRDRCIGARRLLLTHACELADIPRPTAIGLADAIITRCDGMVVHNTADLSAEVYRIAQRSVLGGRAER
jgi:AcrR family transcriptional regulator